MSELRLPMLGDLERAIMEVAWARPLVTVRDVVEAL
ncbi:MAG: BlaI/MecI/CopY family transcriptional regulator, partial [Candidatus Kerfeldbacteria bacterium]|nr:BlaI/MecI/CopY family transcriptional regulator [Candidatus Kerfeldbacteria bacterium]